MSWSLEHELIELTGISDLTLAARSIGLIDESSSIRELKYANWVRGGAETYILPFNIELLDRNSVRLILKAYTPTSVGRSLEEGFERMFERRDLLVQNGVSEPRVYTRYRASWIEQHLDNKLSDMLRGSMSTENKLVLLSQAKSFITQISALGFEPINPIADMMVHEDKVYWVDFGTDLGVPMENASIEKVNDRVSSWLRANCADLMDIYAKIQLSEDFGRTFH